MKRVGGFRLVLYKMNGRGSLVVSRKNSRFVLNGDFRGLKRLFDRTRDIEDVTRLVLTHEGDVDVDFDDF